jgi:2-alkyl-3-oxoalkanoate reductase
MKVLVTGGGGFLGAHLCQALIDRGHEVTVLGRGDYPHLKSMGVRCLKGDIQNPSACLEAVKNQEAVFHSASKVAMWGRWQDFYQTNVVGTQNIVEAMKEAGSRKLIYTSTPSVVFSNHDHQGAGPDTPYPALDEFQSRYAKSKAMAEQYVLGEHNPPSLLTVAIRPHLIFGPGDKNLIPRLVSKARKGRLRRVGDGKNLVDVIHVRNAVHAHLCAFDRLENDSIIGGRAYFVGQEKPVELWSFINRILDHYKVKPVTKEISFNKAYTLGSLAEKLFTFCNIYHLDPPMTRFVAMQLAKSHYFDHAPAKQELGYEPIIGLDDCLKDLNTPFR